MGERMLRIGVVSCCWKLENGQPYHLVSEEYIQAVQSLGALPLLIPALGPDLPVGQVLDSVDGLLLTGSLSNIEPRHYLGQPHPHAFTDPARDATALPLIRAAVAAGVPLFGICRGFQEMNVAFGGSLCQAIHQTPGRLDHREIPGDMDSMYQLAHEIRFAPGGLLQRWYGKDRERVNSLHHQGIEKLAPALAAEAYAPDGLVEAIRVKDAASFALGVQWHPEWRLQEQRLSQTLFSAFREASQIRRQTRARL